MNGENNYIEKVKDFAKNAVSFFQGALPLLEKKIELLPINPQLRDNALWISIVLAAVAGLGAFQTVKRRKIPLIPWVALLFCICAVALTFALTGEITFGLRPLTISWAVQTLYVLIFAFLGATIGGFVGMTGE